VFLARLDPINSEQQVAEQAAGFSPTAPLAAPSRRRGPASTAAGRRSRDRVLQAARDLITESGIDRVRVAEIARRAGMSSGQVMYYFTSKEHILLETLALCEYEDTRNRRDLLPKAAGAWRQLELFIDLYLGAGAADPSWILWTEAWARAPHDAEVSKFLDDLMRPWRQDLAEIIELGTRDGSFRPRRATGDLTLCLCALLDGLTMLHMYQMPDLPRQHLIELATASVRAELTPAALV
jgi:AcrR family transcriptional regulator